MINKNEIYHRLQNLWIESNDLKVGDSVTLTNKAGSYQFGWNGMWYTLMDRFIGRVFKVKCIEPISGISITCKDFLCSYRTPFFVLEKVDSPQRKIVIDDKEIAISEESYQNLKKSLEDE